MKTPEIGRVPFILAVFCLLATAASAATVNAVFNSAADIPITSSNYTATGNTIKFTLSYAPPTGTGLTVVENTGTGFIEGLFDNLTNGQPVVLTFAGMTYYFVANYYGGTGNDLVLEWASSELLGWGEDEFGQVGDGTNTYGRTVPVPVTTTGVLSGKTIVATACGWYFTLALCSDGTVAAWGQNSYGKLGDGTGTDRNVPVAVNTSPGVSALYGKKAVAIAAGISHSLALCSDGTVVAWGGNSLGQLGDGTGTDRNVPVAVNTSPGVSALYGKKVVRISAGRGQNVVLCSDGTVAAWGYNSNGRLGDGTTTNRPFPVAVSTDSAVSALFGRTVVFVSTGGDHSLALCSDGSLVTWGANYAGQLGDGSTTDRLFPALVNTEPGVSSLFGKAVVSVAAGRGHSLALCSDGTVAAWGDNTYRELGDTTTTRRSVPVAVNTEPGVSALFGKTVVAIVGGQYHSLAMCSDGAIAAWGLNGNGQLGDGTMSARSAPVLVTNQALVTRERFSRVFTGPLDNHSMALVVASPETLAGTIQFEKTEHRLLAWVNENKLKSGASTGGEPNGAASN